MLASKALRPLTAMRATTEICFMVIVFLYREKDIVSITCLAERMHANNTVFIDKYSLQLI